MCERDNDRKHFGSFINFTSKNFSEDEIEEIVINEIDRQGQNYYEDSGRIIYPEHILTDLQLLVLRYLRNYIFAVHGHDFKAKDLAECFKEIPVKDNWTKREKENVKVIVKYEQKIKELNDKEWTAIKDSLIKETVYLPPSL